MSMIYIGGHTHFCLQKGQLKRPDHADLRYKCRTYARMLQHLKVFCLIEHSIKLCNFCLYIILSLELLLMDDLSRVLIRVVWDHLEKLTAIL